MKDAKPKLELKRRTIANLSNIEMGYVYGGGGDDEEGISQKACDKKDDDLAGGSDESITDEIRKKLALLFPTRMFC